MNDPRPERVALFVTCLVDLLRPGVGFSAVRLIERAGYQVEVPAQACCGQVNYNAGDHDGARELAAALIATFLDFDYVVVPSGSCAAMIRCHFPGLFAKRSPEREAAETLSGKTHELTMFLHDIAGVRETSARLEATAVWHDACSGYRELGLDGQPRTLLASVDGLELAELSGREVCCGFGGLFAALYPDISNRMASRKCNAIRASGATHVIGPDLGCLMHLEGKLHRDGVPLSVLHVAEVLAGDNGAEIIDEPADE